MYKTEMQSGDTPTNIAERLMQKIQVQILVSRRQLLAEYWHLDLCSPFWRIYINEQSGAFLEFEGKRLYLKKGVPWLIPAWVRFKTGLTRPVWQNYLHFQCAGLPSSLAQKFFDRPFCFQGNDLIVSLSKRWRSEVKVDLPLFCWAQSLAHASLALAFASQQKSKRDGNPHWLLGDGEMSEVLEYIDQHMINPPDNKELAAIYGTSEDHFILKFRQSTGMTPARYSMERRLGVTADWLVSTDRSLEDISEAAGFTDRFHFSRMFKKHLGMPPATYRRMHHQEE